MSIPREAIPTATDRRSGVDRRHASPARPRATATLTGDQAEFAKAVDAYKRDHRRPNPSCAEILDIVLSLGYRKP